ncbi:enhancer of yellow 2 transcription factor-like [Sitodiplosis mosellana]|uniref:enhancer of yellow 2 transcription factor-like n=1 Tax=Sitodiplosis mosellana TaxID=263140 RepID=UPI002445132E|nr:enhancer of yellow 2 transcription factor-like [Sitodiplosis mosellana]
MTLTTTVDQTTILLGERAKLKDLLRLRLTECGWNDEVRLLARDVIKEEGGNVNVDEIAKQITPKSRALVPDTVKRELLQKIKNILSNQAGVDV